MWAGLVMTGCTVQSSSRANSRKRICRENSTGSDATGQGLAPSHSGSLPAALAPYVPVPSAFGENPASLLHLLSHSCTA